MSVIKNIKNTLLKGVSYQEVTGDYLDAISLKDRALNAFIQTDSDTSLKKSKEASLIDHPLSGVPIAYKDNICTKDFYTTCASKMLQLYVSPFDATVVRKATERGMISIGKTNLDEFAMGSLGDTSFYGATFNPWDASCYTGGSSSGSAAAVAMNMAPISLGSDTGGSIRLPAHCCGIVGVKPTYGSVSRYGLVAYASSFDQIGVFASYASDAAIVLDGIGGKDRMDATSQNIASNHFSGSLGHPIDKRTIGVDMRLISGLPSHLQDIMYRCMQDFVKMGVSIKEVSLPNLEEAVAAYYILVTAEATTNLARYDGIRFGYRAEGALSMEDHYTRTRTEGFGLEVKRRLVVGNYVLATDQQGVSAFLKAQKVRYSISLHMQELYRHVDAVFYPVLPYTASGLTDYRLLDDRYNVLANLVGDPAISFPIGMSEGLPYGAQLQSKMWSDGLLMNIVHTFQQHTDHHKQVFKIQDPQC